VNPRSRARCAQASRGLRTYQLRLKEEGLLLQKVHRVERSNTHEYLRDCREECMQESFGDLSCKQKLRRINTFESVKRETE
jgi:hypothetical protein